jgi:signal transduction histidine kinase
MVTNRWQQIFVTSLCIFVCIAILVGNLLAANATPLAADSLQSPIALTGPWQFYWGQLLSPADFTNATGVTPKGGTILVPSSWGGQVLGPNVNNGQPLPYFGVATYRTQVVIPREKRDTHTILLFESVGSAYRVWVNGVFAGGLGTVVAGNTPADSPTEKPQIYLNLLNITPNTGQLDIIVQVSNYSFREGGIFGDVQIGQPYITMMQMFNHYMLQDMLLIGVFIVVGLYHIMIYLLNRRDSELLWLAGFCFSVALRSLILNKLLIYSIMPNVSWTLLMHMQYSMKFITLFTYLQLIRTIYRQDVNNLVHQISVAVSLLALIYVIIVPPRVFTFTLNIQIVIIVVILCYYLLVVGYLLLVRKRDGARLNLISMFFLIVTVIHDFYLYTNRIQSIPMFPYAILMTLLVQAIIISYRYALFQQRNIQLAQDLQDINRNLEEKVTERTNELNHSNAQLVALTNQRSHLIANIAHDMGSPLNGVQMGLNILKEDSLNFQEKEKLFGMVMTRINYVKHMVDDLFQLVKLESRQLEFDWEDVSVTALYTELSDDFGRLVHAQGRVLVIEHVIPSTFNSAAIVRIDRQQLFRVLQNLIDNAIKYSTDSQAPIILRSVVRPAAVVSTYEWYVEVVDQGVGIAPEHISLIFERFYTRSDGLQPGRGLGLAICKEIIERHGGEIGVQSMQSKGSTFFFTLPLGQ